MALTAGQLTILKAAILADGALAAQPNTPDGAFAIAVALNAIASPSFTVWKTSVPVSEVGEAMVSTEVSGLTTANTNRLQVMVQYSGGVFNPSRPDTRAGFDSIFSGAGGVNTRALMLALWKRLATRAEKVFATGTGSDASPATLTWEGSLSYVDVLTARSS